MAARKFNNQKTKWHTVAVKLTSKNYKTKFILAHMWQLSWVAWKITWQDLLFHKKTRGLMAAREVSNTTTKTQDCNVELPKKWDTSSGPGPVPQKIRRSTVGHEVNNKKLRGLQ